MGGKRVVLTGLLAIGAFIWAAPAQAESLSVEFNLPSDNGYRISFSADRYGHDSDAALTADHRSKLGSSSVTYALDHGATVSARRIHADLGSRGNVSVTFQRQSERRIQFPSCRGYLLIQRGVFSGSFDFTGEHGFASASGTRAQGAVTIDRTGRCRGEGHGGDGSNGGPTFGLASCARGAAPTYVAISRPRFEFVSHFAFMLEHARRRVVTLRSASLFADSDTFEVKRDLSSAVVTPSAPFAGRGTYEDKSLDGDLTVEMIGIPGPVPLTPAHARLKRSSDGSISTRCGGDFIVSFAHRAEARDYSLAVLDALARARREGRAGHRHVAQSVVDRAQHVSR